MARAKQIIRGILLAASLGVIAIAGYLSYQRYVGTFTSLSKARSTGQAR